MITMVKVVITIILKIINIKAMITITRDMITKGMITKGMITKGMIITIKVMITMDMDTAIKVCQ
jgi:hypothetical protein